MKLPLIIAVSSVSCVVAAQVAFSTFEPGDVYNSGLSWGVKGPREFPGFSHAFQFESQATGIVDTIRFAGHHDFGDPTLVLMLYRDLGGFTAGGAIFGTWSIDVSREAPGIDSVTNTDVGVQLIAGSVYWLGLRPEDDGRFGWNFATSAIPSVRKGVSMDNGQTFKYFDDMTPSAFEITVTPVPEPCTLGALLLGTSTVLFRRRRSRAVRSR